MFFYIFESSLLITNVDVDQVNGLDPTTGHWTGFIKWPLKILFPQSVTIKLENQNKDLHIFSIFIFEGFIKVSHLIDQLDRKLN